MSLFNAILRRLGLAPANTPEVEFGRVVMPPPLSGASARPETGGEGDIRPGSNLETGGFGPVILPEPRNEKVRMRPEGMSIQIRLPADRARPGTLELLSATGDVLSGPWPAVGKADPSLGADYGNPDCDRMQSFGDAPTGGYEVIALLPPAAEERGAMLVGPHGVIQLRPVSGEAAMADRQGRTSLLIHGGSDHLAPTDGSIRIPNEGMAELVGFIPARPGAMQPRIQVVIEDTPVHAAWVETAPNGGSKARQGWYSGSAYSTSSRGYGNTYVGSGSYYDDGFSNYMMLNYYQQLYMWEALREPPMCLPPAEVAPDAGAQQPGADFRSEQDQAAAAALGAAGYGTVSDSPAADAAAQAVPDTSHQPQADFREPDSQAATPAEASSTPSEASSGYTPSGGAYDR